MNKKFVSIVLVLAMILALGITAIAANGDSANGKVSNIFLTGRVDYKDYNNANFHCNAINGNGRVWTTLGKDYTQQMNDLLTFERTDLRAPQSVASKDTTWLLINRATQDPVMSANGKKIEGWNITDPSAEMFICEQCGSQLWVSFSNNSGEPDGKNIQINHPGKYIEIVKVWLDAEGNVIKSASGLSAKFTVTWMGKDGVERSMQVGPGKHFFPEDLIDSIVVTENNVAKNYTLINIDGRNVIGVISSQLDGDKITFTNKEDPYAIILKEWDIDGKITKGGSIKITEGEGLDAVTKTITAKFDIYAYDEDADGNPVRGAKLFSNVQANQKVYVNSDEYPVKYIVAEQTKPGFVVQPDQVIEVEDNKVGTCTFVNEPDEPDPGKDGAISLDKFVDGIAITAWAEAEGYVIGDLIDRFNLYKVDADGAPIGPAPDDFILGSELNLTGVIYFGGLDDGWYAIKEILTPAGEAVFEQAPLMYILIANGITFTGTTVDFDYDAFYTISNGYGGGYTLGYPNLNNSGDIFPIGVVNAETNVKYPSFCANAGSRAFAGQSGMGCAGYLVTERINRGERSYGDFLLAYNYIEDKYGNLDDFRPVTQIITWALLGAIEIPSTAFDNINWAAVASGGQTVAGVPGAKGIIEDIWANFESFKSSNKIVDVVYMVCEHGHNYADCQPQLVPIYGESGGFNNKTGGGKDGSVSFTKVKYGGLLEVAPGEFNFELFKLVGNDWVYQATYPTGFGGVVSAGNLAPGSYVFKEKAAIVLDGQIGGYGYKHVWTVGTLAFTINIDGSVVWDGGEAVIDNHIVCKGVRQFNSVEYMISAYLGGDTSGLEAYLAWLAGTPQFIEFTYDAEGNITGALIFLGCTLEDEYEWEVIPATCASNAMIHFWHDCHESHAGYIPLDGTALGHDFLTEENAEDNGWDWDSFQLYYPGRSYCVRCNSFVD